MSTDAWAWARMRVHVDGHRCMGMGTDPSLCEWEWTRMCGWARTQVRMDGQGCVWMCVWVWVGRDRCGWAQVVMDGRTWPWMDVDGGGWMWMGVDGCGWAWTRVCVDGHGHEVCVDEVCVDGHGHEVCGRAWMCGCVLAWVAINGGGWGGWAQVAVDGGGWMWMGDGDRVDGCG
jgi:hypothetical protein